MKYYFVLFIAWSAALAPVMAATPICAYRILHEYPHDAQAFTQGLVIEQGRLFESTGRWGASSVREVALKDGQVLRFRALADQFFGEGLTVWQGHLIQLTWRSGQGFVYALDNFDCDCTFSYQGEGWGLTHDGQSLIMSNGSSELLFLHPDSFVEQRRLTVREGKQAIKNLNELEYIEGEIFANIWTTNRIARINPNTGQVNSWLDLTGLKPPHTSPDPQAVLNGIAYDAQQQRLFVTGKLWPSLFEIEITDCF